MNIISKDGKNIINKKLIALYDKDGTLLNYYYDFVSLCEDHKDFKYQCAKNATYNNYPYKNFILKFEEKQLVISTD